MNNATLSRNIIAWLSIIRIGNAIALGYAAIVGYLLSASKSITVDGITILKIFIAAFVIGGSSNIINDYYDSPIDAINKPWRPIPTGLIKAKTAYFVAIMFAIAGIVLSFSTSLINGLIALIAFILSYGYSRLLKKVFVVGNIVVAFLTSLSIIYGGIASSMLKNDIIIASILAFLLNLGREFIKGIEDIEGDRKYGVKTIAIMLSTKKAFVASLVVFSVLIIFSIIPYLVLNYSILYLVLALIGVDVVTILALIKTSSLQPNDALKASRLLKIAAFCGITAFLVK